MRMVFFYIINNNVINLFTPLNIYNGMPKGVPQDVKGQLLQINQLKDNPP